MSQTEVWNPELSSREGLAENKPGHKPFEEYRLPKWVQHPIKHTPDGIDVEARDYMHGAGDGVWNHYNMSPAHVAALFGDLALLKTAGLQALSQPDTHGELPAHCAIRAIHPWVLQYLVDMGADVTSRNRDNKTPEDLMYLIKGMADQEQIWLRAALDGKLTEKESIKSQEWCLKKDRPRNIPQEIREIVDQPEFFLRLRKFHYGTVEWHDLNDVKFKPPPREEGLAKRDLPRADFSTLQAIKGASKPPLPCALLFPGIGSQYIGIMKEVMDNPSVQGLLDRADEILGWDVRQLALEGPEDKICQPLYCQPLLFVACNAALELLKSKHADQFERLQCVAGLSIGEYTALVAAGVLDFDAGLRLVKLRAEALHNALNASSQSMCSIAGLSRDTLEGLCYEAVLSAHADEKAVCQIASSLFPSGFAVAGTKNAVGKLMELAKEARALQARELLGGGGYHTLLMKEAEEEFGKALVEALPEMQPPRCAIYFNRCGKKVSKGTEPRHFIQFLKEQLTHEVLWESTVKNMLTDGVQDFIEVGPMKQLRAMMKRVDQDAFQHTTNITV